MEKKNTGLIVLVIILCLLVLGLGGYIVYDKVLNKPVDTEIKEDVNNVIEQNESVDYVKLENELKENFDVIYGVYSSPNTYCGKDSKVSEKNSPNGGKYQESTQFKTYDELYNYLSEYATSDVLSKLNKINKEFYLEEDGKLYCSNLGKGGVYKHTDTLFKFDSLTKDSATGIANVILVTDMSGSETYEIEKYNFEFTKNNDKFIISKFELVK